VAFCDKALYRCEAKTPTLIRFFAQLNVRIKRSRVDGDMVFSMSVTCPERDVVGRPIDPVVMFRKELLKPCCAAEVGSGLVRLVRLVREPHS